MTLVLKDLGILENHLIFLKEEEIGNRWLILIKSRRRKRIRCRIINIFNIRKLNRYIIR